MRTATTSRTCCSSPTQTAAVHRSATTGASPCLRAHLCRSLVGIFAGTPCEKLESYVAWIPEMNVNAIVCESSDLCQAIQPSCNCSSRRSLSGKITVCNG